ncbi:MAG: PilW family protein, partial [Polyangiales bacterium]
MTPRRPSPRRPSRRAGFTLVELMVAMVAGLIAIGAIYTLSAASARHFHEQQRVARTQSALRLAMNRLRHDFGRAGFLGTPNSTLDARCATQAAEVAAIDRFVNDDPDATAWLPNAVENGVSADSVVLTGNYASADGYLAIGLSGSGDTVFLQQNWQAFRRSFGVPFDEDAFAEVFRTGRLLRLRTQQGRTFILRITGINADRAAVRFTPALPIGGSCVVGLADGALVSPLSRIEYTVGDLSRDGSGMGANMAPADGPVGDDDVRGRTMSQLVRRELTAVGDDAVEGSARSLLDHVADFNLRFVYDLG